MTEAKMFVTERLDMFNYAIIVPSLDPDEKFNKVVDGMAEAGFRSIVLVDDGSKEENKEHFRRALAQHPECVLLTHAVNRGKGCALKTAFAYIAEKMPGIDGVITVDGDGQHTPADSVRLAEHMAAHPGDVVFGCRDFDRSNVPLHNKIGNKITAKIFQWLFGMKIGDAQTGLRGIPFSQLKPFTEEIEGERYEYESNMLMYISENKLPYSQIPIETVYIDENESSHFRVIKDSVRIYKPILSRSRTFKYTLSSVLCTVVDVVLFTVLNKLGQGIEPILLETLFSTGISRVCSALLNFEINYRWVFSSNEKKSKSVTKYFTTAALQYLASYLLCTLFFFLADKAGIVGFGRTLIKLAIDCGLFFASYAIQKKWVFQK